MNNTLSNSTAQVLASMQADHAALVEAESQRKFAKFKRVASGIGFVAGIVVGAVVVSTSLKLALEEARSENS
jgi:hypothetical protein